MTILYREKITKGWKVMGRNADGKLIQISRRYHSKAAADLAVELAKKSGYTEVELRTVQGFDKRK